MSNSDHKETCRTMLKILTSKEYVVFTNRCNDSIKYSLNLVTELGRHLVLFQEEGGWLTYEKFIKQANLTPIKMITDDGLIYDKELEQYDYDVVLLLNSLPGYSANHNMDEIMNQCIKNDIFLINDVSGSIGSDDALQGDIIVGSFGDAKPVNLGKGGFIAFASKDHYDLFMELNKDFEEPELDYVELELKLKSLESRRELLISITNKVKKDLETYNIVHPDHEGLNVIVKFSTDLEKNEIIAYCDEHKIEYTVCPREIRILDNAISLEIKRLTKSLPSFNLEDN